MIGIANYGDAYFPVSIAIKRSDGTAVDPTDINLILYWISQIDGSLNQILEAEPQKQFETIGFYYYPISLAGLTLGQYEVYIEATVLGRDTHFSDNFSYRNNPQDMWAFDPANSPQQSSGGYLDNLNKVKG